MTKPAGVADKGVMAVGVYWSYMILSTVLVGLRWYTRRFVGGQMGWDDICLAILYALILIAGVFITVACTHGMGQKTEKLTEDQASTAMMFTLCAQFVQGLAIGWAKVVIGAFLLRVVNKPWHRWFVWVCMSSIMTVSLFLSIIVFAQCTPVQSLWDHTLAEEQVCHFNLMLVAFVVCSYAAAIDIILGIFPWVALRNLNMKRKDRITICASLSLGILAGIIGIIRTVGLEVLDNTDEYLHATAEAQIWTASEIMATIAAVTLPSLRPLWRRYISSQKSSSNGYHQQDDARFPGDTGSYPLSSMSGTHGKGEGGVDTTKAHTTTRAQAAMKNGSDETILLPDADSRNIMCVQEITVTREDPNAPEASKKDYV